MSNDKKKWTLKSIAAELGVSNATVSNAFNRPDQLSKSKREEILKACKELGYFGPNKAAQSLRKGSFNIVALVLPDSVEYMVSDPVASSFMRGVASVLEAQHINLLLFSGTADNVGDIVDFVDGLICYGRPRNPKLIEHLANVSKQVVTVDFDLPAHASINIDNQQAAFDVASKALNDDSDVAIFGLRLLDTDLLCRVYEQSLIDLETSIAHQRYSGYLKAIEERGLTLGEDRVWNIPESSERFANIAAKELLNLSPRPNTVLCMSDLIALPLLREAKKLGVKIPQDLKVVGFDGIDEALRFSPSLTTIHQNSEEKGREAAKLFLDKSDDKVMLGYTLKMGQSC
ncbi:LacI family transcriptional regulator [Pseudoalteromonas sp. BMB]|uniref:LacI family DNA-binding transcriptional regulator n=1 Tax=Pseudoalteromonas sp. BMB TaxID=1874619 RepID=UPI00083D3A48|nr:LacI family DNA-binding transcriptional regulator [Pseudoalteromonas sp. BMB]ODB41989.1 LacI family transcriptional regulator [Pseudoalteromonas sp. BMB]